MTARGTGNWGLRLLALILAVVIYHVLKNDSLKNIRNKDRDRFAEHAR